MNGYVTPIVQMENTMEKHHIIINEVPAILWGQRSKRLFLYIHGKGGSKEEAAAFSEIVCQRGFQVLSIDLPEHGQRTTEIDTFDPWHAVPELKMITEYAKQRWQNISLFANSIGAWFSMLSFSGDHIEKCLFVSPVTDMKYLVSKMMKWANVTETQLQQEKIIKTNFGETLSWDYWNYILENPVAEWTCPTHILYGEFDNLIERDIIENFSQKFKCDLTVMENGEHWFHTPEQLQFLSAWEERCADMLITERLILRKWTEADADSLFEYASDPDIGPAAGWQPHKSREESLDIIKNVLNGKEAYAICEKGSNKAIGAIELRLNGHTDMTNRDDECELGYWLAKPFWGRGYMPEAARELIRRGFEELGMTTIWCGYYDGNQKSKRVQEKVGFVYHHTCGNVPVPLMNEVRIGHTNVMTKAHWEEISG